MGFTLTVHSHALPGYDREVADAMAVLILDGVGEGDEEGEDLRPPVRK